MCEQKDTNLSAHHVLDNVFEVGFVMMLVKCIGYFFFEEVSLYHIFDNKTFGLYCVYDRGYLLDSETGIRFDHAYSERKG